MAFLISLFGVLDYRISEVRLTLSYFSGKIEDKRVKKIKEFIRGDRQLSYDEVTKFLNLFPQVGLWVISEKPEIIKGRIFEFLAPLLDVEVIKDHVLDYLLSLGGFVSLETLIYMNKEIKEGKLNIIRAIALASKRDRPYDYSLFQNVKSLQDFEKALTTLIG